MAPTRQDQRAACRGDAGEELVTESVLEIEGLDALLAGAFPAFGGAFLRRVWLLLDEAIGKGVPMSLAVSGPVTLSGQAQTWLNPLLDTGWFCLVSTTDAVCYHDGHRALDGAAEHPFHEVAIFGGLLIYPGIWGAILSSAIGSVLGGPRVLQALASDGLAPRFLARLSPTGQPTVATLMSGAIALSAVALGGLNAVAQFVTILFLTLYILINLAAGTEKLVGDPSYRPTIHVPWWLSMLGALGTLVVMFLISPLACGLAHAGLVMTTPGDGSCATEDEVLAGLSDDNLEARR